MNSYSRFLSPRGFVIFLLHGVIPANPFRVRNYTRKHILQTEFEDLIVDLKRNGNPVSMQQIADCTRNREPLPPNGFAVTFDDGFENNLLYAAPVLSDHGVPATFYITSHFVDSNASSWIDLIEYAFERTPVVEFTNPCSHEIHRCEDDAGKRELLTRIRMFVKNDSSIDPYWFAQECLDRLGVKEFDPDPYLDQKMTWAQVAELSRLDGMTVGGHSHTHRILSFLSDEDLATEIDTSLQMLRACLGADVRHYSYPEGLRHCYNEDVIRLLKGRGIVCSPSAESGTNAVGDDLFHLKRIMVV